MSDIPGIELYCGYCLFMQICKRQIIYTLLILCRQLALCQFPGWMMVLFNTCIMSVPASMLHLHTLSPDVMAVKLY